MINIYIKKMKGAKNIYSLKIFLSSIIYIRSVYYAKKKFKVKGLSSWWIK